MSNAPTNKRQREDGAFLRGLAQLTSKLESVPHVRRVLSLTNARGFVNAPGATVKPVTLFDPASGAEIGPAMRELAAPSAR